MINATPLLRAFAQFRLAKLDRQDVVAVQRRQLHRLLHRARKTRFGCEHGFETISTVETFQRQVPLRRYEALWEDYWKTDFPVLQNATWPGRIRYFAKTSGTSSGTSKYIPVTEAILRGNRRAVFDMLSFHLRAKPDSQIFGGKSFVLSGSSALEELAPEIYAGDMSALAAHTVPRWAHAYYFPPVELEDSSDWESRLDILRSLSFQEDIRAIGGTASWLLLFLQEIENNGVGNLKAFYPNLELISYGGVNFEPYRAQYEALVAGTEIDLREGYAASEGFIAVADRGVAEGVRLQVDGGIFYEFVPVEELEATDPPRFWLATAEIGVNYALILSTPGGAWSYILGDTVRFLELDPPRLLVTGRTSTSLSAFGEHLIEEEIVHAVSIAANAIDAAIVDFSVAPVYPGNGERQGHHVFVVEFDEGPIERTRLELFSRRLDSMLSELNDDYRVHRASDIQMKAPAIVCVARGTFAKWMKSRGKMGGQNKVPRVITDPRVLASLRDFASSSSTQSTEL